MDHEYKTAKSLVTQAKLGDKDAIEKLFTMYSGSIYSLALKITAYKSLAKIITLLTFIEARDKINSMRADSSFHEWLRAIAVYIAMESIRSHKYDDQIDAKKISEYDYEYELDQSIMILPDNERIIFILSRIEGYSIEEIADLLSVKNEYVEQLYNAALEKLIKRNASLESRIVMEQSLTRVVSSIQPSKEFVEQIIFIINNETIKDYYTLVEKYQANIDAVEIEVKETYAANSKKKYLNSVQKQYKESSPKEKFDLIISVAKTVLKYIQNIIYLTIIVILILATIYIVFYW